MTSVNVGTTVTDPTHDLSLSDGSTTMGLIFAGGPRVLQEVPLTPPAQAFENEQRNWIGGRGRLKYDDDPTGFFDSWQLWSTTDERLMPTLQWRFAKGIRANEDTSLPTDNSNLAWWKLYGNTPASKIARYLDIPFSASASYSAGRAWLIIRRRGTPGTLTMELCSNNAGDPDTVLQTITKTTSDVTDTLSVFLPFSFGSSESLTSGTTYHIKIYGASSDNSSNHWEILCNSSGTSSKYSSDNSTWTTSTVSMFYRVSDTGTARQWRFFFLEGGLYAVSQNDDLTDSTLKINGVRGTATAADATSLTCNTLTLVANQYAGAYIRIYDGTGDGQVRQIVSNTTGGKFVVATWDKTPDTTSRFVVYGTDYWNAPSGTPGLGVISANPVAVNGIAYLPSTYTTLRRMRVNGNSHDFADDGTNAAGCMALHCDGISNKIAVGLKATSQIKTADPVTWGTNLTLSTAKNVGSSETRINNLFSHNRTLYIFKEDGPYTYTNGIIERQGANFQDVPDRSTGQGVGAKDQYLFFGWGHSIERMLGSNVDDMMNFKRGYNGMPEDRKGIVSCIVSAVGWLFFVIDGGSTGYSSIICWNGMGWHEVFRGWATGIRIRNAVWQPNLETRGRLWFDVAGEIAYIEFPLYAANPRKDTTINYNWEGAIVTSTYDSHDQNLYKVLGLLRVFSEAGSAEIDYQTNANVGTNTWTPWDTADTQPVFDTALNLGSVFQIRFRFRLQMTNTRTPTVLTGWQLSGRMMPLKKYQYMGTFKTDSDQTTYSDEPDHDPNTLYDQLITWAETQTTLTLGTQSNSSNGATVTISLPSKSVDWIDTQENKWGGRISLAILEV